MERDLNDYRLGIRTQGETQRRHPRRQKVMITRARSSEPVHREWLAAWAIGLAALLVLLSTCRDYGMVWDEGHTIRRERMLADWFSWLIQPPSHRSRADAFSRHNLDIYWPFSREEPDGHPPFYALLGLAGWALPHGLVHPLTAYRFGPMVLCAATTSAVFLHTKRRFGWLAGLTSAAAILLIPRSFSHAHYAHYDMPMSCLWVLAQISFSKSLRSRYWVMPYGLLLGLAAGTKFTGWFAIAPAILWSLSLELPVGLRLLRSKNRGPDVRLSFPGIRSVLIALPIAVLTLVAIQPPWWTEPFQRIGLFLSSNLTRYDTKPIPTLYFGTVYEFSLPWHNTLVLTGITVPIVIQVLALFGLAGSILERKYRPEGMLWVMSWAVLMVVRGLPSAPGHDGERLFLPSILSLAVLSGIGVAYIAKLCGRRCLDAPAFVLSMAAIVEGLLGIVQLYPYTLSYYNLALGGLSGAERAGFELTYYWDTLGPEFFDWTRDQSRRGELQLGFPTPLYNMILLREWGTIPPGVKVSGAGPIPLQPNYVLQRRKGVFFPYDDWIDRHGHPIFSISRQGVDLLRIFPYSDVMKTFRATRDLPVPEYLRRAEQLHSRPMLGTPGT
jgi:hypothetical protein